MSGVLDNGPVINPFPLDRSRRGGWLGARASQPDGVPAPNSSTSSPRAKAADPPSWQVNSTPKTGIDPSTTPSWPNPSSTGWSHALPGSARRPAYEPPATGRRGPPADSSPRTASRRSARRPTSRQLRGQPLPDVAGAFLFPFARPRSGFGGTLLCSGGTFSIRYRRNVRLG